MCRNRGNLTPQENKTTMLSWENIATWLLGT